MKVHERMLRIPGIALDVMGLLADEQEDSYRLENADSDIPPSKVAVEATRAAVGLDEYNSWLPLVGLRELRQAVVRRTSKDIGLDYDWTREVIITNGAQEGLLSTLIRFSTLVGETVLDMFAGSCALGRAAVAIGRSAVLIEKDEAILNAAGVAR